MKKAFMRVVVLTLMLVAFMGLSASTTSAHTTSATPAGKVQPNVITCNPVHTLQWFRSPGGAPKSITYSITGTYGAECTGPYKSLTLHASLYRLLGNNVYDVANTGSGATCNGNGKDKNCYWQGFTSVTLFGFPERASYQICGWFSVVDPQGGTGQAQVSCSDVLTVAY